MSEHWEYRRDLIVWLLALPFSLLPVALVVPILAIVDFIPLLWSRTPRRDFREAVAHLASDLSLFLQPPPSPAERREIERRWQESLRNLPRKRRADVAELLRVFLNLQRPGTVAGSPAAALYARRDDGGLELMVRATSSRFANDCTAASAAQAAEWTGPCLDFALEHDGRPLGVLRLRGVDPARFSPPLTSLLHKMLAWFTDDLAHDRYALAPHALAPEADAHPSSSARDQGGA